MKIKLVKKPYLDRINWTKDNMSKILSMDKDFILKAESKLCFVAVSLVLRELSINPATEVRIPIFLDATASGIQHLAALMKDCTLAKEVNLVKLEHMQGAADIYEKLLIPINEEIIRVGREHAIFKNLASVHLERSDVKQPIMTKTYNVSPLAPIFERLLRRGI